MEASICPQCSGEKEMKGTTGTYFCVMCQKPFQVKINDLSCEAMKNGAESFIEKGKLKEANNYYKAMILKYPEYKMGYLGYIKTCQNQRSKNGVIQENWYKEKPIEQYNKLNELDSELLKRFEHRESTMIETLLTGRKNVKEQYDQLFFSGYGVMAVKFLIILENIFLDKTLLMNKVINLKESVNEQLMTNEQKAYDELLEEQSKLMDYITYILDYYTGSKAIIKSYNFEELVNSKVFNYFKIEEKKDIVNCISGFIDCKNAYENDEQFINLNNYMHQLRRYYKVDIHNDTNPNYVDLDVIREFADRNNNKVKCLHN